MTTIAINPPTVKSLPSLPTVPLTSPGDRRKPNNRKLGHRVYSFSLEALATCTGKTGVCGKGCYATRFLYRLKRRIHKYMLDWTRRDSFVPDVLKQIRQDRPEVVRPHVSGDYYGASYAGKWLAIFRKATTTPFYFYTRSWRKADGSVNKAMVGMFGLMAKLPNVHVWFSEDRETGPSPAVDGVRVAFTCFEAADETAVPNHAALVFRNTFGSNGNRKTADEFAPAKWTPNGVWICPVEQKIDRPTPITCSSCGYCFARIGMPKPK